jgi:acyl-CoA synthetase (NDP forming)
MLSEVQEKRPQARLAGVLVEKMYMGGEEVIVGMKRDANFGAMLMFGLGGIYVEAFRDVSFRIAPVDIKEIQRMIEETAAGKILMGLRGTTYDVEAVALVIHSIGRIALDFPAIQEIEINPLKVLEKGKGAVALDARMILS